MLLCFYFVMGLKEMCLGGGVVCFSQNHCVFSSVYVVLSVVFYPIGFVLFFVPVQNISTSGMSITFLNKQNVSRYYAPPSRPHSLAIVYKMLSVFPFHMSGFLFWSPVFDFTSIISHYGWHIKAWNGDKSTELTGSFSETSSHHIYESSAHTHMHTHTCSLNHSRTLAIMIQAWRHLSQQQITSALLTSAHVCVWFIRRLLTGHIHAIFASRFQAFFCSCFFCLFFF